MKSKSYLQRLVSPRIGFHYFQDTAHYTNRDLVTWIPKLVQLNAKWIILRSESTRAIPEQFLSGLINKGITPIVQIFMPLPNAPAAADLQAILEAYSRWGVKQVILFDKPNTVQAWSASGWSQQDLVERFIDKFIPLAMTVAQSGMTPVFPPLQPGGNYWDLTFLRLALQSIIRRGYSNLIKQMALSAYSYTFGHELDWGVGAQAKWPKSKPYTKLPDSQDQCGFYNFEWVQSVARQLCGKEMPILMLGAGIKEPGIAYSPEVHIEIVQNILERLNHIPESRGIPTYVQCCNFYLLAAEPGTEEYAQAWFKSPDTAAPIVEFLTPIPENIDTPLPPEEVDSKSVEPVSDSSQLLPLEHYLLLPQYEWGVAEFHLDAARPFILKHHPTIGFSIQEAMLARKITVVGGESSFSEEVLEQMRSKGSLVDRISGDGTSIATQLAER